MNEIVGSSGNSKTDKKFYLNLHKVEQMNLCMDILGLNKIQVKSCFFGYQEDIYGRTSNSKLSITEFTKFPFQAFAVASSIQSFKPKSSSRMNQKTKCHTQRSISSRSSDCN